MSSVRVTPLPIGVGGLFGRVGGRVLRFNAETMHESINLLDSLTLEEKEKLCLLDDRCGQFVRLHVKPDVPKPTAAPVRPDLPPAYETLDIAESSNPSTSSSTSFTQQPQGHLRLPRTVGIGRGRQVIGMSSAQTFDTVCYSTLVYCRIVSVITTIEQSDGDVEHVIADD